MLPGISVIVSYKKQLHASFYCVSFEKFQEKIILEEEIEPLTFLLFLAKIKICFWGLSLQLMLLYK